MARRPKIARGINNATKKGNVALRNSVKEKVEHIAKYSMDKPGYMGADMFKDSLKYVDDAGNKVNPVMNPKEMKSKMKQKGYSTKGDLGMYKNEGYYNSSVFTNDADIPVVAPPKSRNRRDIAPGTKDNKGLMHTIASSKPMKAVAGASVASLIMGNMVRSKGQQSNSELYGQRTPYM